jgi:mannose-6-phosphate isomerase-like protein (cupin superfamily)
LRETEAVSVRVTSKHTAEHYKWGDGCDGWYLVKNDRLTVIQESMPPGTSETRHFHRKSQQYFFVLKGEATLEVDGSVLVVREQEGVAVPPGAMHQIQNLTQDALHFLVTSEPPSHGDREAAPR